MKTKEELETLRTKVSTLNKKLEETRGAEGKEEAIALDKTLGELSEDELKEVTAGTAFSAGSYSFSYFVHENCGGVILHVGNPFVSCCCSKCGETHYWHYSFDYREVVEK